MSRAAISASSFLPGSAANRRPFIGDSVAVAYRRAMFLPESAMRLFAALPLALVVATPAAATEPRMPAHVVAEMFCMARILGDMSLVSNYLSSSLYTAVGQALIRNDEIEKQFPDDKPPLGDGVPWASYPDAVPSCTVDYAAASSTPTAIPVTYDFPDAPDARWADTLLLVEIDGEWQLDDVQYEDGSRLTAALTAVFEG
jgi:hypothetical protein